MAHFAMVAKNVNIESIPRRMKDEWMHERSKNIQSSRTLLHSTFLSFSLSFVR